MKHSHLLLLLVSVSLALMVSCKDSQTSSTEQAPATGTETTTNMDPNSSPSTTVPGEPHFKCSKPGCTGSADAQGKCPVCGSDLVHNAAYHGNTVPQGSSPANAVPIDPKTGQPTANVQPTPPPAQNAKGEYHYTCAKGHPGAATAGNCATCGAPLTHNKAYHDQ